MNSPNALNAWTTSPVGRVAAPIREQVSTVIREAILDFRLRPGQRLVERELIEQLGVSRTTVREALRELVSEGLITIVPQKGAMVSTADPAEAEVLYDCRAVLEPMLVERFVLRATDQQIEELGTAVAYFSTATAASDDIRGILAAKDLFYKVLEEGAASTTLRELNEGIRARVRVLRATTMSEPGRAAQVADELSLIVDAAKRRDARGAAEAAESHVRIAAGHALRSLALLPDVG